MVFSIQLINRWKENTGMTAQQNHITDACDLDQLDAYYMAELDEQLEAEQIEATVRQYQVNYCD